MSYNTKNYVEQGGDRLVIGGQMEFKEGAGVSGFPSDASFFVCDLTGVDLSEVMDEPLDITELFPLDQFNRALAGEKPVLFINASLNDFRYSVLANACDGTRMIVALAGMPSDSEGELFTIVTILLLKSEDRVYLRANRNNRLASLLND